MWLRCRMSRTVVAHGWPVGRYSLLSFLRAPLRAHLVPGGPLLQAHIQHHTIHIAVVIMPLRFPTAPPFPHHLRIPSTPFLTVRMHCPSSIQPDKVPTPPRRDRTTSAPINIISHHTRLSSSAALLFPRRDRTSCTLAWPAPAMPRFEQRLEMGREKMETAGRRSAL